MCHSAVFGPPNCSSFRCAVFSGAHDLCRVESRSCYILSISLISICNEWLIYSSVPTDPMKDWKYLKKNNRCVWLYNVYKNTMVLSSLVRGHAINLKRKHSTYSDYFPNLTWYTRLLQTIKTMHNLQFVYS